VLAKLQAEGLIMENETGARGRKTYAITKPGRAALEQWVAAPTDYTLRYDPILKAGFLSAVPTNVRLARVEADLAFFTEQLGILKKIDKERKKLSKSDPRADVRDMAIGMYTAMVEWCRGVLKDAKCAANSK
jgi:DNA-binding PadR family transcriptional regulator